jgi:hypothetical protein
MKNSSFSGFSTGYDAETTQQLLAEFWILADWPPFSPDLNLLDFSICSLLQAKVQATPYTNLATLCPSIAAERVGLVVVLNIFTRPAAHSATGWTQSGKNWRLFRLAG